MIVHSSLDFTITAVYPSIEHPGKIAVLVTYKDFTQKVFYLEQTPSK